MNTLKSLGWPVAAGLLTAMLVLQALYYRDRELQPAPPPAPVHRGVDSYAAAVKRATPAVVNIYTAKIVRRPYNPLWDNPQFQRFFNRSPAPQRERVQRSLGSAVIMSRDGYLLTNNHLIAGATEILVLLADGREAIATVVGSDQDTDLAVLAIKLPDLQPIEVGQPELAEVGDVVLAIGNPYGFGQTVTQGIVSATGRFGLQLNTFENYIQTDAAINPGNSGGALVDSTGNLLGINTAIYSVSGGSQGIGLAIPADYALKVLGDIVKHGYVVRGWMGIEAQLMPARIESETGLIISGVDAGGPAEKAGLKPGDVLVAINGKSADEGRSAMNRVALMTPGDPITLTIYRDGKRTELKGTVGQRPSTP